MIDNIVMVLSNINSSTFGKYLTKLKDYEIIQDTETIKKMQWKNMRIVYYPRCRVMEIRNSIHKLYNILYANGRSDNSNDFTLQQLKKIVMYLAELFETDLNDIVLQGRFEFGVNIIIDKMNPNEVFQRYISYKSVRINPFETIPAKRGKPKHRSCYLSDYRIKAYQKELMSNLNVSIGKRVMRYEVVTTELRMLRKITGLNVITLADLIQPEIWTRLKGFILSTYDKIQKIPIVTSDISLLDLAEINLYCSNIFYTDTKKVIGETKMKLIRRDQKEVYKRWDEDEKNLHNIIRKEISNKLNLISNN
jgi:hypothetical protein